jgi:hypothetical protein
VRHRRTKSIAEGYGQNSKTKDPAGFILNGERIGGGRDYSQAASEGKNGPVVFSFEEIATYECDSTY